MLLPYVANFFALLTYCNALLKGSLLMLVVPPGTSCVSTSPLTSARSEAGKVSLERGHDALDGGPRVGQLPDLGGQQVEHGHLLHVLDGGRGRPAQQLGHIKHLEQLRVGGDIPVLDTQSDSCRTNGGVFTFSRSETES